MDEKEKITDEKLMEEISNLTKKEKHISYICEHFAISEEEVFVLVDKLKKNDINIDIEIFDDGYHLFNRGERDFEESNEPYKFTTDENNEFKFILISDTLIGSKYQQLSILNDIYQKAKDMEINTVIHCGNFTAGTYRLSNKNTKSLFLVDSLRQVDYIASNYPKVDGIKTYFITGKTDEKHASLNGIDVGKRITKAREDMIYLGDTYSNIKIDNTNVLLFRSKLDKTYTMSYRAQQQINSFRLEDKPDVLIFGGLLQAEKFYYRGIESISVPSLCATTKDMKEKRHSNAVGAWYVTVKTDKKGKLSNIDAIFAPYKKTDTSDYKKHFNIITNLNNHNNNNSCIDKVNKFYCSIKNGMTLTEYIEKTGYDFLKIQGMIKMCEVCGKRIDIAPNKNGEFAFYKVLSPRKTKIQKDSIDSSKLINTKIGVLSDTHIGNKHQQMHLINDFYLEMKKRGVKDVFHCGDLLDGLYPDRRDAQMLRGFDEQMGYCIDMYPRILGITTYSIDGNHDYTYYRLAYIEVGKWMERFRDDFVYLGQDCAVKEINKIKFLLDHPGGGSAQSLSYKPQKRTEELLTRHDVNFALYAHYHNNGCWYDPNLDVSMVSLPSFCDVTEFQHRQGLSNYLGGYCLDIYSDKKGNIHYFKPEAILYGRDDVWEEYGKDKKKVKKLVID